MGGEARKKQVLIYFYPCLLLGCSHLFTLRIAECLCVCVCVCVCVYAQAVFPEGRDREMIVVV